MMMNALVLDTDRAGRLQLHPKGRESLFDL